MEVGITNRAYTTNLERLTAISNVAGRTVDFLLNQADEGTLKEIKTQEQLGDLHKMINDVLVAKLRQKFSI
jgi:hypothetical protein